MTLHFGTVKPGTTLIVPFHTFDSNDPSASVTITGLATTDIEVFKDGGNTARASDAGYALLGTDGIDEFATGVHGVSIDLADNTTANFYEGGSQYFAMIGPITVDAATVNFIGATWRIGYEGAILDTTIATLASQTSFTLEEGPAENNALNGCVALIHDLASAVQMAFGVVGGYTGATKTVTLNADPGIFTMAAGDNISFFPPVGVTAWNAVALATTNPLPNAAPDSSGGLPTEDASGHIPVDVIEVGGTSQTAGDIMGSLGEENAAAAAGDPSTTESVMQYIKQIVNVLVGTTGVTTFPAAAAPANNVSLAEIIRSIYDDTNSLDGTKVPDTISLANINAEVDTALATTTYAEPGAVPSATASIEEKISWLHALARNKITQTATTQTLRNDADSGNIATSTVSDDGTTFTRGEFS